MRYRKQDPNDDYVLGPGSSWLVDSPEAVAQAIKTRMRLLAGEWFLDRREGLDVAQILGYGTQATRDQQVQERILGTRGVTSIVAYSSEVVGRGFSVTCTVDTLYGTTTVKETL